jgi:hypothetical protein
MGNYKTVNKFDEDNPNKKRFTSFAKWAAAHKLTVSEAKEEGIMEDSLFQILIPADTYNWMVRTGRINE